ncbi:hypothetical protein IEQ34_021300 [Dendrobium chrysotoxum]|uniref:Uncharacterized protein n=1 Tax=Dendrobium chrysotoxum TaxID=161865 RepID=A0AAV7G4M3_DENCH|nr:hypothetical protein IEQ34_021300 [Dendrobium chrysotoxum]
MELMKHMFYINIVNIQEIINIKNIDGRTTLHIAMISNLVCNLALETTQVPPSGSLMVKYFYILVLRPRKLVGGKAQALV